MARQQGSGMMVPLIIIGATLFGLGTWQALKPKEVEVDPTFTVPENPRTLQAPPLPESGKDAAQVAAESGATEAKNTDISIKISDAPWIKAIMGGVLGEFRSTVVKALKDQQSEGLNCSPALGNLTQDQIQDLEEVTCTDKDGTIITGTFDTVGDGTLEVKDPSGQSVQIRKFEGSFTVQTESP
jgi:hypothetical protein